MRVAFAGFLPSWRALAGRPIPRTVLSLHAWHISLFGKTQAWPLDLLLPCRQYRSPPTHRCASLCHRDDRDEGAPCSFPFGGIGLHYGAVEQYHRRTPNLFCRSDTMRTTLSPRQRNVACRRRAPIPNMRPACLPLSRCFPVSTGTATDSRTKRCEQDALPVLCRVGDVAGSVSVFFFASAPLPSGLQLQGHRSPPARRLPMTLPTQHAFLRVFSAAPAGDGAVRLGGQLPRSRIVPPPPRTCGRPAARIDRVSPLSSAA